MTKKKAASRANKEHQEKTERKRIDVTGSQRISMVLSGSPFEKAKPVTLRGFLEFKLLASLLRQNPLPNPKKSPFTADVDSKISSFFSGPDGETYWTEIQKIVAAPSDYYKGLVRKWRAQYKPKRDVKRKAIHTVRSCAHDLSGALDNLPNDTCLAVGFTVDPESTDQRAWHGKLLDQLTKLESALEAQELSTRSVLLPTGRPLDVKWMLVASMVASAINNAGSPPTLTAEGPFMRALTLCLEAAADGDLAAYDTASERAINIARGFLPVWKFRIEVEFFSNSVVEEIRN